MAKEQLELDLEILKTRRRTILSDLDRTDTEIIGIKLELERRSDASQRALQEERDQERECPFDE